MYYTELMIRNIIRYYYDFQPSTYVMDGFDDIVCIIADFDRAVKILTPRESEIMQLIMMYGEKQAGLISRLSLSTIKFHLKNAVTKISLWLNKER